MGLFLQRVVTPPASALPTPMMRGEVRSYPAGGSLEWGIPWETLELQGC